MIYSTYPKTEKIDLTKLPSHIAFIMDGNRRWSKSKKLPFSVGHRKGFEVFKKIILFCNQLGIRELSFFAFSKENWNRSREEVDILFKLMLFYAKREIYRIIEEGIRVRIIGDRENLPSELLEVFQKIEDESKSFDKMIVNVMINYSGQYDVIQAVKKIISSGYTAEKVDYNLLYSHLLISSPDLLIRTGGEYRISNFILFQLAYTELYFCPKMWPEFEIEDLIDAIVEYQRRERRWGK
ncbi:MAG: polyprenyl diphosphate synthase [bacterium]